MRIVNIFFLIILIIFNISCSKDQTKVSVINEDNLEMQMIEAYSEGLKEFNKGDIFFAAKKFIEVELLFRTGNSRETLSSIIEAIIFLYPK